MDGFSVIFSFLYLHKTYVVIPPWNCLGGSSNNGPYHTCLSRISRSYPTISLTRKVVPGQLVEPAVCF